MKAMAPARAILDVCIAVLFQICVQTTPTSAEIWNAGGDFELGPFDTGNIYDQCYVSAPWGSSYWGVHGYSWYEGIEYPLSASRFASWGSEAYLFGHETSGRYGIVRYIQGDVWGGSVCGVPPPWNIPEPLLTHRRELTLKIDIYRDTNDGEMPGSDRIMFAINVWFKSHELSKPLVMDLIFYLGEGDGFASFEDQYAYHYQYFVGETPFQASKSWTINLSPHIRRALRFFGLKYAWDSLYLHQLEFLLEIVHAKAAATIDNFYLIASPGR